MSITSSAHRLVASLMHPRMLANGDISRVRRPHCDKCPKSKQCYNSSWQDRPVKKKEKKKGEGICGITKGLPEKTKAIWHVAA